MKNQLMLFLFVVLSHSLFAQEISFIKQIKTGITFGIGHSKRNPSYTDWQTNGLANELGGIQVDNNLSFRFGLSFLKNLDESFTVRINTVLSFWNNTLEYDFINLADHREEVQPIAIEFPISLIYTIRKFKRVQPSIIMGFRQIRNVGKISENKLTYQTANLYVEAGVGMEINLNKIRIKPEICFSKGGSLLIKFKSDVYNNALYSIHRDPILFNVVLYKDL